DEGATLGAPHARRSRAARAAGSDDRKATVPATGDAAASAGKRARDLCLHSGAARAVRPRRGLGLRRRPLAGGAHARRELRRAFAGDSAAATSGRPKALLSDRAGSVLPSRDASAIRIGTRGSALALAQARTVADAIEASGAGPAVLVPIATSDGRR